MAKTLAQIQAKHEHTYQDEDGKTVTSQTFIKDFTFFEDIEYLYSKDCPDGIKIDSHHVALYCRFMSYQANGDNCYESHATLARKHKTSPSTVKRRISDLKKLGLVTTEPNPDPKYDTLLYTALPLTDAHVIPPDQLTAAPIIVSAVIFDQPAQMPAPEPVTVEERGGDDVPDWFNTKDEVIPRPTPPMNEMDAACTILIRNIDIQAETESFTQFTERVCRNNRKIRLPQGIEDYFKNTHPEIYDDFDTIPF